MGSLERNMGRETRSTVNSKEHKDEDDARKRSARRTGEGGGLDRRMLVTGRCGEVIG